MGMANSAQAFQRLAYSVVSGIPSLFCYLDDLIITASHKKSNYKHSKNFLLDCRKPDCRLLCQNVPLVRIRWSTWGTESRPQAWLLFPRKSKR